SSWVRSLGVPPKSVAGSGLRVVAQGPVRSKERHIAYQRNGTHRMRNVATSVWGVWNIWIITLEDRAGVNCRRCRRRRRLIEGEYHFGVRRHRKARNVVKDGD